MAGRRVRKSPPALTKNGVVERLRDELGQSWNTCVDLVEVVLAVVKNTLSEGENVKISGFGSFVVRQKSARRGRNPATRKAMIITRRKVLTFKPSPVLRQALNLALRGKE